ncbi:hypothetical protein [Polyangium aurulentum]|uniref:hypothetical protein n=1 Tax=Polyangium aurulentum TaxID=2567896 RepID=UPI0010AE4F82|nr:hypothetical protein [Polyangium aurulentum]UQA62197.1 hypothetical protein E8A73_017705 [Polyangium aurulentum]
MRLVLASSLVVLVAVGCSANSNPNTFTSGGEGGAGGSGQGGWGTGASGQGGEGGTIFTGSGGSGGGNTGDDCSTEAKLVYVLSDENELYSFDPPSKLFKKIGTLGCNTPMSPNSMAIDRNAVAWVNYVTSGDTAGAIWKVSTKDASCDPAPAVTLPSQWVRLGMGYSTNGAGNAGETLFVTGTGQIGAGNSPGLGKIENGTLSPISNFSPNTFTGESAELTGTGDGRLFGYFTTFPVYVGEINKATGAVTNQKEIAGLETPSAWAFSFWGGDFYLYAASSGNSRVSRYRPSDGTVDNNYMTDVGFRIVGAGVSTCAPLQPPK